MSADQVIITEAEEADVQLNDLLDEAIQNQRFQNPEDMQKIIVLIKKLGIQVTKKIKELESEID